jgi:hypothetical protein
MPTRIGHEDALASDGVLGRPPGFGDAPDGNRKTWFFVNWPRLFRPVFSAVTVTAVLADMIVASVFETTEIFRARKRNFSLPEL